jgi:hypothetical protein
VRRRTKSINTKAVSWTSAACLDLIEARSQSDRFSDRSGGSSRSPSRAGGMVRFSQKQRGGELLCHTASCWTNLRWAEG